MTGTETGYIKRFYLKKKRIKVKKLKEVSASIGGQQILGKGTETHSMLMKAKSEEWKEYVDYYSKKGIAIIYNDEYDYFSFTGSKYCEKFNKL